jgi:exosome complex component RRP45
MASAPTNGEMMGKTTQYRTTEEEVILTRLLEKAIRRSEAVDREALCVVAGEKVRCVWV